MKIFEFFTKDFGNHKQKCILRSNFFLIGNKTLLRSEKTPKCIKYALKGGKDYKEKGE